MDKKIILNKRSLKKTIDNLKKRGKKIVFTNGCFDLLHLGHIKYLTRAKKLGDCLIVAVNSDASVRKIKGKGRPLTSLNERIAVLAGLEAVDLLTGFNESTPLNLIKFLRPHILVKGADWKAGSIVGATFVKSQGGRVKCISYLKGYSTSKLIAKIARTQKK